MSEFVTTIIDLSRAHQDLAYSLVFLLAMSEALPVVGAFVPGTAIILGISALIPTGAVALWPMIISATLGAIVGDGIPYWLGHRYHRAITSRWPLSHYPALIAHGDAFFERHGGKSVFIARFTPGMRAIVPLIAGLLLMPPIRFYGMNVLSAMVWAPSHVLAGALIGASLALLGAVTGRLAIFVVLLVMALWGAAIVMRYAIRRLPPLASRAQERLWAWARVRDTWLSRPLLSLLDPGRKEVPGLALLGAILIGGLWLFFGVLDDVVSSDPLLRADTAVFQFLQSLRTGWVDQLMVAITEIGDGTVTIAVTVATLLWLAWRRAWRAGAHEVAAVAVAGLFTLLLKVTLHLSRPNGISSGWDAFSFPSGHTTVNAALYGFLAIMVAWEVAMRWRLPIAIAATLLVSAIAFSRLYLGAHRISDLLAGLPFGVAWAALLGIAYFRHRPAPVRAGGLGVTAALTLLIVGGIHIDRQHAADMVRYSVRETMRTMPLAAWWQQGWSELPVRRVDLLGEFEEPFTIQWAGDLGVLENELAAKGWRLPAPWTIRSALAWLEPNVQLNDLPVLPRLDNGHQEGLVMVLPVGGEAASTRFVLRLWRSGVVLGGIGATPAPLWIGTVVEERIRRIPPALTLMREMPDLNTPSTTLASAMALMRQVDRGAADHEAGWDGVVLLGRDPSLPSVSR